MIFAVSLRAKKQNLKHFIPEILENLFRRKEQNVTVIEVPELVHNLPPPMAEVSSSATKIVTSQQQQQQQPAVATKMPRHHVSKKMKALAKRTEESKHFRCADCQRKISQKNLFRVSRYCVDCTSTSRMVSWFLNFCKILISRKVIKDLKLVA